MAETLLTLYTSRHHIKKKETILKAKNQIYLSDANRVYLGKGNLIECLKIEKENQRVKVRSKV